MSKKIVVFLLFAFSSVIFSYGQQQGVSGIIQGVITDENTGEKLMGANVYIQDLKLGVSSDKKGFYQFDKLPLGEYSLTFSYIGYESVTKKIELNRSEGVVFSVRLRPASLSLNEVVITGKSEARKLREQAMPISVISMKDLQGTVSDVSDILSKTVGVTIRQSGGVGGTARISVRGLEGKRIGFFIDDTPLTDQTD